MAGSSSHFNLYWVGAARFRGVHGGQVTDPMIKAILFHIKISFMTGFSCQTTFLVTTICVIWSLSHFTLLSFAQVVTAIVPDQSLGSTVSQSDSVHTISDGTVRGGNLFHSFDQFSLGTNETASFADPGGNIDNILSRVTGGQASFIDGTFQSEIPGANLFFLNPNGVMFGPNARLDMGGAFHVSTADVLRFSDGAMFYTDLGRESTFTLAPVSAFGFGRTEPAAISVQGSQLQVDTGQGLSIIGGHISITGDADTSADTPNLSAPGGQLHLVSVASAAEVSASASAPNWAFDFAGVSDFGDIAFTDGAHLTASRDRDGTIQIRGRHVEIVEATLTAETNELGDASQIEIVGRTVILDQSRVHADALSGSEGRAETIQLQAARTLTLSGGRVSTDTAGLGTGGLVDITAGDVILSNRVQVSSGTSHAGDVGIVRVDADSVDLSGRAQIISSASRGSTGAAGQVQVTADRLSMTGGSSALGASTSGSGDAGELTVRVGELTLSDNALITSSTFSSGDGGTVTVSADTIRIADGAQIRSQSGRNSTGDAGRVSVTANRIEMTGGGLITSSAFGMVGNAGAVQVTADQLTVSDGALILSETRSGTTGNAGMVQVTANHITLTGESTGLGASTSGSGDAGELTVQVGELTLSDEALITSSTFSSGDGGTVTVLADTIQIADGARIRSQTGSNSTGDAGRVSVTANRIEITGGGLIISSTFSSGDAGTVMVVARVHIRLSGESEAGIQSGVGSSTLGSGNAGVVKVRAGALVLTDEAIISTSSLDNGTGDAGRLMITAGTISLSNGAVIRSLALEEGNAGDVVITGGTVMIENSSVTTESERAAGGELTIVAHETLQLRDSALSASVRGGPETQGGNVMVNAKLVVLQNSQIRARAIQGEGGRIRLRSDGLVSDTDSEISASSDVGIDGEVEIQALTHLSDTPVRLGQSFEPIPLLYECDNWLSEDESSTFVTRRRDSVPADPNWVATKSPVS